MNIDYATLEKDLFDGTFRRDLQDELTVGFRQLQMAGERLPVVSHYASQIAEIVNNGAPVPLRSEFAYELYQETLAAVEAARAAVLGDEGAPS